MRLATKINGFVRLIFLFRASQNILNSNSLNDDDIGRRSRSTVSLRKLYVAGGRRVPGAGAAVPPGDEGVPGQREGRLRRPRRRRHPCGRGVRAQPHLLRTEPFQGQGICTL